MWGGLLVFGIIMDLDDTIISTSPVYYRSLIELMSFIEDSIYPRFLIPERILEVYRIVESGDCSPEAQELYHETTVENIAKYPDRWPKKLAETFIECCLEADKIPTREEVQKVYNLGLRIFEADYRMIPGAIRLINYLAKKANTRLFIITHGSEVLQERKVTSKEIFKKFEKIVVCPIAVSKGVEIKKLMEEYDGITDWVMIGDSIPSDINPALSLGIPALNVRQYMSHIADGTVLDIGDSKSRYRSFRDLSEVEEFLKKTIYNCEGEWDGFQIQV
jgi:FMN phosphatase YigB (HAD superfamily)